MVCRLPETGVGIGLLLLLLLLLQALHLHDPPKAGVPAQVQPTAISGLHNYLLIKKKKKPEISVLDPDQFCTDPDPLPTGRENCNNLGLLVGPGGPMEKENQVKINK